MGSTALAKVAQEEAQKINADRLCLAERCEALAEVYEDLGKEDVADAWREVADDIKPD